MRSLRYLNTILTLLTILLGMQLWTSWSTATPSSRTAPEAGPAFLQGIVTPAMAQAGEPSGIPNAGAQRKEVIDLLKKQIQQTDELLGLLKSGQLRVRVDSDKSGK